MIDISVIILSFNSEHFVKKCIGSLSNSNNVTFANSKKTKYKGEIIFIDNASRDNTEKVVKMYDFVKFIKLDQNYGFSYGNNVGLKLATGKYVLFLNPDAFVQEDTLEYLLDYMEKNLGVGGTTCFLELVKSKSIDPASHRGFPTPWASFTYYLGLEKIFPNIKIFSGYHQRYKDLTTYHEIDSPSGSFFLIRKKILDKLNGFDEDYFMYGEDLDLSYRIKQLNWKIMYLPAVKAFHYKGMSSGIKQHSSNISPATQEEKAKAFNAFYDSMILFYDKHYKTKYPKIIRFLVFLGINLKRKMSEGKMKV